MGGFGQVQRWVPWSSDASVVVERLNDLSFPVLQLLIDSIGF